MPNQKILIIDDDKNSVRFLELELKHEGYSVEKEYDGFNGLERALTEEFDLILLDVMLPSLDGMEILKRFRNVSKTPVIMLTARDAVSDKVSGLDGGANDYLTKPFAIEELLARMRAALKKIEPEEALKILSAGKLIVDEAKHLVTYEGQPIYLTKREFDLLYYLLKNHDKVCSRDRLMEQVWGYNFKGETNLVDVYVRYLRNKIDHHFHTEIIRTIRGVGYIINLNEKNEPV